LARSRSKEYNVSIGLDSGKINSDFKRDHEFIKMKMKEAFAIRF
jgi:hypothetical protein